MLTHDEHQSMIMFDRLLMAAKDNETIADLLDQTLNVARMIDPRPDEKIMYGPLQRMHFEWQNMKYRLDALEKKMDQYINSQNRYPSTWPSNPGWATTPYVGTYTNTTAAPGNNLGGYSATAISDLSIDIFSNSSYETNNDLQNLYAKSMINSIKDNLQVIDAKQNKK